MSRDGRPPPAPATPRIEPGSRSDIGLVNSVVCRVLQTGTGTAELPNLFTTVARHRGLFRRWLLFASAVMPRGRLPRADTELVILRVAHLCDSDYERDQHVRLGRSAGLTDADLERVRQPLEAGGWTPRQTALLRATDELHHDRLISDDTWAQVSTHLTERDRIELCFLVGHYEMVAMTLRSLGIQVDPRRAPGARG